uniref:NUC173 domain-containing protein n=1 Tax=Gongylonema pulchrum TaxID=637853 RepID=A0A183ETY1_9BILA
LFSNFVRCWFIALDDVSTGKDHILPMLLLVMDTLKIENLACEPALTLQDAITDQVNKMSGTDIKAFCVYIAEKFVDGQSSSKRWLSAAALFLGYLGKLKNTSIEWKGTYLHGMKFLRSFLTELLNDVVNCSSFRELIGVLR